MNIHSVIKLFDNGNVCVVGLRGSGKDMLCANVTQYRNKPYICNVDYGGYFNRLTSDLFNLGGNTFADFKHGTLKPYSFPYPDYTDVFLSDVGVYYPSHECSYLDKHDKGLPLFMALSRQLGLCNVHLNVQNLERAWTKIREQSDTYIRTNWCKVFFGKIVVQSITIYERAQSVIDRVPECPFKTPLLCDKQMKEYYNIKKLEYRVSYGDIKNRLLIYINKSSYDTRFFKKLLEGDA